MGLRRVPAKVELNRNNKTGTWSDPNVKYGYWSVANPVVRRGFGDNYHKITLAHKKIEKTNQRLRFPFEELCILHIRAALSKAVLPPLLWGAI